MAFCVMWCEPREGKSLTFSFPSLLFHLLLHVSTLAFANNFKQNPHLSLQAPDCLCQNISYNLYEQRSLRENVNEPQRTLDMPFTLTSMAAPRVHCCNFYKFSTQATSSESIRAIKGEHVLVVDLDISIYRQQPETQATKTGRIARYL